MTDSTTCGSAEVIVGLEDYVVLDAGENAEELTVLVAPASVQGPCPACGVMSGRVKSRRHCTVRDCPAFGRPTVNIAVVVVDPHAGYRSALLTGLPDVIAVVDRFHIAQLANKAVTDVRRRRIWEQRDRRGRKTDPGWRARRDLLRRSEHLTDNGWRRVLAACLADTGTDNPEGELAWTWAAKEYLTRIYDTAVDRAHAHRQLLWWYCWIAEHPVPELVTLATTISAWENEFLNYFDTRATNGRTEGVNRLIKHVKRIGFGYRNTDNYRLRVLYRCTQLPSPVRPAEQPAAASIA